VTRGVWTEVGEVEAVGEGVMAGVEVDTVAIEADKLGCAGSSSTVNPRPPGVSEILLAPIPLSFSPSTTTGANVVGA
jgi:hypothetical protein